MRVECKPSTKTTKNITQYKITITIKRQKNVAETKADSSSNKTTTSTTSPAIPCTKNNQEVLLVLVLLLLSLFLLLLSKLLWMLSVLLRLLILFDLIWITVVFAIVGVIALSRVKRQKITNQFLSKSADFFSNTAQVSLLLLPFVHWCISLIFLVLLCVFGNVDCSLCAFKSSRLRRQLQHCLSYKTKYIQKEYSASFCHFRVIFTNQYLFFHLHKVRHHTSAAINLKENQSKDLLKVIRVWIVLIWVHLPFSLCTGLANCNKCTCCSGENRMLSNNDARIFIQRCESERFVFPQQHSKQETPIHSSVNPRVTSRSIEGKSKTRFKDFTRCTDARPSVTGGKNKSVLFIILNSNTTKTTRPSFKEGKTQTKRLAVLKIALKSEDCTHPLNQYCCWRQQWLGCIVSNLKISHRQTLLPCAAATYKFISFLGGKFLNQKIERKVTIKIYCYDSDLTKTKITFTKITLSFTTTGVTLKQEPTVTVKHVCSASYCFDVYPYFLNYPEKVSSCVRELPCFSLFHNPSTYTVSGIARVSSFDRTTDKAILKEKEENKSNKSRFPGRKSTFESKQLQIFVGKSTKKWIIFLLVTVLQLQQLHRISASLSTNSTPSRVQNTAARKEAIVSCWPFSAVREASKHVRRTSQTTPKTTTMGFSVSVSEFYFTI